MKIAIKSLVIFLGFVLGLGAAIFFSGNTANVIGYVTGLDHDFDPARAGPAPDYSDRSNWAALPDMDDPAHMTPAGYTLNANPAVDVFFIHPTGYLNGNEWNSPMNPDTTTEENTEWMMANQASAYNGCCAVYAPRYREANIQAYFSTKPGILKNALEFAYQDVERAFDYFLEHYSKGRPFIVATHSQGTTHGYELLKRRIDNTPLVDRLVTAYIIGSQISNQMVDSLETIPVCNSPSQTHCLVHWATYGEGATLDPERMSDIACVNPLSWQRDGSRVEADQHQGSLVPAGKFNIAFIGEDNRVGQQLLPFGQPIPHHTWAKCQDGLLFVAEQADTELDAYDSFGNNYHGLDYGLFYMDIRDNAQLRVDTYLADGLFLEEPAP